MHTVNSVLSPLGSLIEEALLRGGGGGVFNLAKRITGSKNTEVRDRVESSWRSCDRKPKTI